jgi:hypothetical protein
LLFLGAGASKPFGVPTMAEFTNEILSILEKKDPYFAETVRGIQADVSRFGLNPDIEAILTVLHGRIEPDKALKDVGPLVTLFTKDYRKHGPDNYPGRVVNEIEQAVSERCRKIDHEKAAQMFGGLWDNLTKPDWNGGQNSFHRIVPQKIFTTNYDLSIETFCRRHHIGFDEGFKEDTVGEMAFSNQWSKGAIFLYKMHGSINYYVKEDGKIVRSEAPLEYVNQYGEQGIRPHMIYPAGEKYATRWPNYEYLSQLRQALFSEPVCLVIGYSFRDIPINNAFLDAIQKNPGLQVILIGPSALRIKENLEFRDHIIAMKGEFGKDPASVPNAILKELKETRGKVATRFVELTHDEELGR